MAKLCGITVPTITRKQYEEGRAVCDSRMLEIENRLKEVDESVSTTKEMEKIYLLNCLKNIKNLQNSIVRFWKLS